MENKTAEKPLFSIKPKMVWYVVMPIFLIPIIALWFVALAFFGKIFGNSNPFIMIGIFLFFPPCLYIMFYIMAKRNIAETVYKFYEDRLEFYEGFLTKHHKIIPYNNIKEIHLREGFIERIAKIGSIFLGTHATTNSGQFLNNIQNPLPIYNQIKEITKI